MPRRLADRVGRMSGARLRKRTLTETAVQRRAQPRVSRLLLEHPRPLLPGRIMPHVLRMPALQIGHPMPLCVLMKSDDSLLHGAHDYEGKRCSKL
jgi:hypothetical protein